MASTDKTPRANLSQFRPGIDAFQIIGDYNHDMLKIDNELVGLDRADSDTNARVDLLRDQVAATDADNAALSTRIDGVDSHLTAVNSTLETHASELSDLRDEDTAQGVVNSGVATALADRYTKAQADARFEPLHVPGQPVMVVIGDSYSSGMLVTTPWHTLVGGWTGSTIKNYAVGGAGYLNGSPTNNYAAQLQRAIADPTFNNDDVSHVFVISSGNDTTDSSAASSALFATAIANFVNSQLVVLPLIWNLSGALGSIQMANLVTINKNASVVGGLVIDNTAGWFVGETTMYISAEGNIHLNDYGQSFLAGKIYGAINGMGYRGTRRTVVLTPAITGSGNLNLVMDGDMVKFHGAVGSASAIARGTTLFNLAPYLNGVSAHVLAYIANVSGFGTGMCALLVRPDGRLTYEGTISTDNPGSSSPGSVHSIEIPSSLFRAFGQ